MKLCIDTSNSLSTTVKIDNQGQIREKIVSGKMKSQQVLPVLENIIRDSNLTSEKISQISVNTGPGSFTGIRVGITVAKVLALLLGVKINDRAPSDEINPLYGENRFD
jgi:tRNA threonylcarbamoyladenosine biosynthesis protein TsaB